MNESAGRIRAFAAIRLGAETDESIERLIAEIRPLVSGVRWVPRDNFHLTLKFLGNAVPAAKLGTLGDELAAIAASTRPFRLIARGIGTFPHPSRPNIIWVGLVSGEIQSLAVKVREACARIGFPADEHSYRPHLTIGRIAGFKVSSQLREILEKAADRYFGESLIDSMALYRSMLGGSSPTYLQLARWRFGTN